MQQVNAVFSRLDVNFRGKRRQCIIPARLCVFGGGVPVESGLTKSVLPCLSFATLSTSTSIQSTPSHIQMSEPIDLLQCQPDTNEATHLQVIQQLHSAGTSIPRQRLGHLQVVQYLHSIGARVHWEDEDDLPEASPRLAMSQIPPILTASQLAHDHVAEDPAPDSSWLGVA